MLWSQYFQIGSRLASEVRSSVRRLKVRGLRMRRFLSLVLGMALLLGVTMQGAAGHWVPYRHWHYVNSYTYVNDSVGLWQVVSYYHVKMNGSSPGYIPSVQKTEPMDCRVPYAALTSVTITYCDVDRLTQYSPDRWRVTTRFRTCLLASWFPFCTDHGSILTFRATGDITERRVW